MKKLFCKHEMEYFQTTEYKKINVKGDIVKVEKDEYYRCTKCKKTKKIYKKY